VWRIKRIVLNGVFKGARVPRREVKVEGRKERVRQGG